MTFATPNDKDHTIFIIDDDESVCRALRRLLICVGLNVTTFASAEEFLQCIDQSESA